VKNGVGFKRFKKFRGFKEVQEGSGGFRRVQEGSGGSGVQEPC
jgi:hypothetical protein